MMSFRPSFLLHSALHNRKLQVALAVLLALTFGLLGFLVMQQEHIAQLERVEGELERDYSAAENTWSSAHLGERFFEGSPTTLARATSMISRASSKQLPPSP